MTDRAAQPAGPAGAARLEGIRNFLLDLDGCLWFGKELAPHAQELVRELRDAERGVFFLTNASGAEPDAIAAKLSRLGIPAEAGEVLAPLRVVTRHPVFRGRTRATVVGKPAVADALESQGIEVVDDETRAEVVVVGNDSNLTYADLTRGMRAVDAGAALLALNLDRRLPLAGGRVAPGTGAIVAALEAATGVQADFVGKPSTFFFEAALETFGVSADDTAMVGDTVASDIAGGRRADLFTILIGSDPPTDEVSPDLHFADLHELLDAFRAGLGSSAREPERGR